VKLCKINGCAKQAKSVALKNKSWKIKILNERGRKKKKKEIV
jgi:hypothetical protein